MTNFSDMLSKAKKVQEQMREVQENIKKIEVEGTAGGDLVKVKDSAAYGNAYVQQIAGWMGLFLRETKDGSQYLILTQGKTWRVCPSDVEVL